MNLLTFPTGFTDQSIGYIRTRVGEELTGESADREIDSDVTRWGHFHEAGALERFAIGNGIQVTGHELGISGPLLLPQILITDPDSRFGSTPDGLIVLRVSPDGLEYEVEPVEVKCPPTYDAYIGLFECDTPTQLKKEKREYYWQLLDQMQQCGATRGHFVMYHPKFKVGNHKCILFDAMAPSMTPKGKKWPLREDLKLLAQRKEMALIEFDRIRSKLMAVPPL